MNRTARNRTARTRAVRTPAVAAGAAPGRAIAVAHPNIALVKYWGKRDARLNLPAAGSFSITLDTLQTRTEVVFDADLPADEVRFIDPAPHSMTLFPTSPLSSDTAPDRGVPAGGVPDRDMPDRGRQEGGVPYREMPEGTAHGGDVPDAGSSAPADTSRQHRRVSEFLDIVRDLAGSELHARVRSSNNFPTAAGLASSASGFAALARAATAALGLEMDAPELSALARRGSGSAARSILGGFVAMEPGSRADGADAVARPVLGPADWPLAVVIAVTATGAKQVASGTGMEASRATSPYYQAWIETVPADVTAAIDAAGRRDFAALAEVGEASCLAMHGVMLATRPGLIYWNGATVDCIRRIRELRDRDGRAVFFTVDAGPQVKAVCLPAEAAAVAAALAEVPGVREVMTVGLGEGAAVVPSPAPAPSGAPGPWGEEEPGGPHGLSEARERSGEPGPSGEHAAGDQP